MWCRAIRTANGLSQKEVADAGGLDQSRVSEIERGRYLPGLDMAMRLANGLGVTLTEIVGQWEGARGASAAGRRARSACLVAGCQPRRSTCLRRTCSAASAVSGS